MPALRQALATATSETPILWASLTMGVCHTFSNSSTTVKLTNVYMQAVTFAHREFKVITRGVADVKFLETLDATAYEGALVSGTAYAGKDNIDSFGVCS
jgi:hypothetical protein